MQCKLFHLNYEHNSLCVEVLILQSWLWEMVNVVYIHSIYGCVYMCVCVGGVQMMMMMTHVTGAGEDVMTVTMMRGRITAGTHCHFTHTCIIS